MVRGPDINASEVHAGLEPSAEGAPEQAVRLGLAMVRTVGQPLANRLVQERETHGRYRSIADVARRVRLSTVQAEALATGGAFDRFVPHRWQDRRQALWSAGAVATQRPDRLPGTAVGLAPQPCPG